MKIAKLRYMLYGINLLIQNTDFSEIYVLKQLDFPKHLG